jgi:hypothetical protein
MPKLEYQISLSLDAYKALTARLEYEGQTYNDIVRELLGLDSILEHENAVALLDSSIDDSSFGRLISGLPVAGGFFSRGLWLPNGTSLRARHKGKEFTASIENDQWISNSGNSENSPSAAASAITGNNVNGLRFWEARLPSKTNWARLDLLVGKL